MDDASGRQGSSGSLAGEDEGVARRALSELMEAYCYWLYAYARRSGIGVEDAEDLTQGFMARGALEKGTVEKASEGRGRFRSFLLKPFRNYVSNEQKRERAVKRRPEGGWLPFELAVRGGGGGGALSAGAVRKPDAGAAV